MLLHAGNKTIIRKREIVGVFDIYTGSVSKITSAFLKAAELGGNVKIIGTEIPKTAILTAGKNKKTTVYLSPLSAATIKSRINERNITPEDTYFG